MSRSVARLDAGDGEPVGADGEAKVLEIVGFVNHEEVRAEVLEVDAVVGAVIQQRAGAGLEGVDHLGELLDGAAATGGSA